MVFYYRRFHLRENENRTWVFGNKVLGKTWRKEKEKGEPEV